MIKNETSPSAYKMVSFDVSSLFTMVSSDCAINLILKKIYDDQEIETKISRKDIFSLHRKSAFHFWEEYLPTKRWCCYGISTGSSVGRNFYVHFERTLMPQLEKFIKPGKRYRDDIIIYIKPDFLTKVI